MPPAPSPSAPTPIPLRWPAEWEPHEYTLITWPQRTELWSGRIAAVRETYTQIARALTSEAAVAAGEQLRILVNDTTTANEVRQYLDGLDVHTSRLDFWTIPTDDVWIRDYGPLGVYAGSEQHRIFQTYQFTGWGGKFEATTDNAAATHIARLLQNELREAQDFVLEGGAIESNGEGILLTTEACLLHPNRNPGLSRGEIESRLRATLGVRELIWLPCGLPGDDTDGHVDMLARWVGPETIVCCTAEPDHPAHAALKRNLEVLQTTGVQIHTIPMPPARWLEMDGERTLLPESYANFYIGNQCVLMPVFGDPASEREAREVLGALFPRHEIITIPGQDLILEGGGVHCMTMQIPSARNP